MKNVKVSRTKSLAPPDTKKAESHKRLKECNLCGEWVAIIVGLRIPDPGKSEEYPTSFSYVCEECYEKFSSLRSEIIEEKESKIRELEERVDPEDARYQKMMNIIQSGRITPKRRQEIRNYINKLYEDY